MADGIETTFSEWTQPPTQESPRFELEYEWEMEDWDGMEVRNIALTAATFEEAEAEARGIIDGHNSKVGPEVVGCVTRARIKTLIRVDELPLG